MTKNEKQTLKELMIKYGFNAPDMTVTEFVEDILPSAQAERKKGKWQITDAYPHNVYCSECHKRFAQTHWGV